MYYCTAMSYEIDINCDLGESYGRNKKANSALLLPYVSSCNIACGMHGGDYGIIKATIQEALKHDIQIGAHPSFPDFYGFGRRKSAIGIDQLKTSINFQLEYLNKLLEEEGAKMSYIKPHGALYNTLAINKVYAQGFINCVNQFNPSLKIMGLAGSAFEKWVGESNLVFIPEAFADRTYNNSGTLLSRTTPKAIIHEVDEVVAQVLNLIKKQLIISLDNRQIDINCKSICVHGDHPNSLNILKGLSDLLTNQNITLKAF